MNSPEITFANPWLLLLVLPCLMFLLLPLVQRKPGLKIKISAVLHSLMAILLVLAIAGMSITLPDPLEPPQEPEEGAQELRVLIVADDMTQAETLSGWLPEGYTADYTYPASVPEQLSGYARVYLLSISADALPYGFSGKLGQYVQDGGSLMITGSDHSLSMGGMQGTTYETLLPVSLDYSTADGNNVALMLVLDCSNRMSQTNGNSWNSRGKNNRYQNNSWANSQSTGDSLAMAKQGAIRSIEALSANDYAGVVSFNSYATLQAELLPVTAAQKAVLSRTISALGTSQGTYYCDALQLAWEQLQASDAAVKHVIFLSDGEPSDWGYDSIVRQMAQEGITVSTIAVGYSSDVLSQMAQEGGGRYYAVTGVADLPDIMLSETEQVASDPLILQETAVCLPGGLPSGLPALSGYIGTTPKENAELQLTTETGDPLLASHTLGKGAVHVFTSDLTGEWTASWRTSEAGLMELKQIIQMQLAEVRAATPKIESPSAEDAEQVNNLDLHLILGAILLVLMLADIAVRKLKFKRN